MREKANYRETIEFLAARYPMMMTKGMVAEALGISYPHLKKIINNGRLKVSDGKIPIGSLANYLCG